MSAASRTGLMRAATVRLRAAGIEDAATDARLLLCHAAGLDRLDLIRDPGAIVDTDAAARFAAMVAARADRTPVARLTGTRAFWGLSLTLGPQTLEPRPDTEAVVEAVLAAIPDPRGPLSILDLGTGTGCILLALLHELPRATGLGLDIAGGAVAVARANALRLGLAARARFAAGDWSDGLPGGFDIVVSNPPYIESSAIAGLEPEVARHDPARALDGGADGLDAYRLILQGAQASDLEHVFLELGAGQGDAVMAIAAAHGFDQRLAREDMGGHLRCLGLQRRRSP